MKLALLVSLVAGAAAFVTNPKASPSRVVALGASGKEAFGNEIGVQAPFGYLDPAGLYV